MADAVEEKINELLLNANQKEDFAANFAHELKTPLTSVIGYADMIYQKKLSAEQTKEAAWYILNEGLRLEALSFKLLDLIVLERKDFILEEMSSEELFANIEGSLKPLLSDKDISLSVHTSPACVLIEYDLFKTLVLNLIDNAIKAGCKSIIITGENSGDGYRISFSDNGHGIPEPELNRITEAFYMVDKSRSRKQHGAGLGLALALKIADIHGSSLTIASELNIGTTISITLKKKGNTGDE